MNILEDLTDWGQGSTKLVRVQNKCYQSHQIPWAVETMWWENVAKPFGSNSACNSTLPAITITAMLLKDVRTVSMQAIYDCSPRKQKFCHFP